MLTLPICLPTKEASKGLSKTINFVYGEDILSRFIPWTQSFTFSTGILSGASQDPDLI